MKLGTIIINREKRTLKICNNQFPCCAKHKSFGGWISKIRMVDLVPKRKLGEWTWVFSCNSSYNQIIWKYFNIGTTGFTVQVHTKQLSPQFWWKQMYINQQLITRKITLKHLSGFDPSKVKSYLPKYSFMNLTLDREQISFSSFNLILLL